MGSTFLKPKFSTGVAALYLAIIVLSVFYYSARGEFGDTLFNFLIVHIFWLWRLGGSFGLDVRGEYGGLFSSPNFFGGILIAIGPFLLLFLYYYLASIISHLYERIQSLNKRRIVLIIASFAIVTLIFGLYLFTSEARKKYHQCLDVCWEFCPSRQAYACEYPENKNFFPCVDSCTLKYDERFPLPHLSI